MLIIVTLNCLSDNSKNCCIAVSLSDVSLSLQTFFLLYLSTPCNFLWKAKYYGMDMCAPPNSYVESLTSNVMVLRKRSREEFRS